MSGDPNVLYDGNHLEVLRRHVRDKSIDLVYGVSSEPWWQEATARAFGWFLGDNDRGCRWPIPTTVRVVTAWGRTA
jgi:hypothetical protein